MRLSPSVGSTAPSVSSAAVDAPGAAPPANSGLTAVRGPAGGVEARELGVVAKAAGGRVDGGDLALDRAPRRRAVGSRRPAARRWCRAPASVGAAVRRAPRGPHRGHEPPETTGAGAGAATRCRRGGGCRSGCGSGCGSGDGSRCRRRGGRRAHVAVVRRRARRLCRWRAGGCRAAWWARWRRWAAAVVAALGASGSCRGWGLPRVSRPRGVRTGREWPGNEAAATSARTPVPHDGRRRAAAGWRGAACGARNRAGQGKALAWCGS